MGFVFIAEGGMLLIELKTGRIERAIGEEDGGGCTKLSGSGSESESESEEEEESSMLSEFRD